MGILLQIGDITAETTSFAYKIKDMAIEYAPKVLGAIVVYIIGSWLIGKLAKLMQKAMMRRNYDPSLQTFLYSLVKALFTILLLLTIFGMLGVNLIAFSALLAGMGIAIGGALNGSLGNFAGGVMMLIFKPFKVGDLVEAQGQTGTVKELGIFNTILLSPDNKTVILPNGPVSTGTIINYTASGSLRVDITMAIAPDQDIDNARLTAIDAMLKLPKVIKTPEPGVTVTKVGDGMTTLAIRPYAKQEDYWDVFFGAQEVVKKAWDAAGIQGPTPHRVIITKS
ncbi:mechanosensitive ion channel family protein [Foetidibacter luteolus]|uniref:mechanosensitive ion channel family protein n=1 Tax=Foetidibacter luteolus TaxID=2608880 RepID=UPI001A997C9E|nr:mechanosensitive ion channel family protein [Foetidibacter luteolus]